MRRTRLNRISARRLMETELYRHRVASFLLEHPYCQVWLAENGISEAEAIASRGMILKPDGSIITVPLSTQVHHGNKRRGADLLDETRWLAVSRDLHTEIEDNKSWARARGYLAHF